MKERILFLYLLFWMAISSFGALSVRAHEAAKPKLATEIKTQKTQPPKPVAKPSPKAEISPTELKFSGDLRLRWQGDFQADKDLASVNQFRLRLNATSRINKYIDFGSRFIAANPALPGSGDQALSDFFTRKTLSLDQVYISFKPQRHFNFTAGKFENPFLHTELIWDDDVSFEGLSQTLELNDPKSPSNLKLNAGEFVVNKNGVEEGSYLLGFQVAGRVGLVPPATLTVAAAVYDFSNEGQIYISRKEGALKPTIKNIKNETNRANADQSGYLSEFRNLDLIGKINYTVEKFPVDLTVDYVKNVEAKDENQGFWAILSLGDLKSAGNIKASYHVFQIQADAVVAAYNNFDFAATNVIGHGFIISYQPLRNTFIDLVAFFRKTNSSPEGKPNPMRTRSRAQISVKF